jgi:hypothetical protein
MNVSVQEDCAIDSQMWQSAPLNSIITNADFYSQLSV